jgi:hypothetical protein
VLSGALIVVVGVVVAPHCTVADLVTDLAHRMRSS